MGKTQADKIIFFTAVIQEPRKAVNEWIARWKDTAQRTSSYSENSNLTPPRVWCRWGVFKRVISFRFNLRRRSYCFQFSDEKRIRGINRQRQNKTQLPVAPKLPPRSGTLRSRAATTGAKHLFGNVGTSGSCAVAIPAPVSWTRRHNQPKQTPPATQPPEGEHAWRT